MMVLHFAASAGKSQAPKLLVKLLYKKNTKSTDKSMMVLHFAASAGKSQAPKLIVKLLQKSTPKALTRA